MQIFLVGFCLVLLSALFSVRTYAANATCNDGTVVTVPDQNFGPEDNLLIRQEACKDNGGFGTTTAPTDGSRNGINRDQCEADVLEANDECLILKYTVIGINFMSALAGMAIIASIMIAGYQYMTAQDNAGQIQKAKQRIIWAITALLLFIFMYALLDFFVPGGVL